MRRMFRTMRVWTVRRIHVFVRAEHLLVASAGVGFVTGIHTVELLATSSLVVVAVLVAVIEEV